MASRHRFEALGAVLLMLLASSVVSAQGTTPAQPSSTTSLTTGSATDQKPTADEKAEPEWRWRFLSVGGDVNDTSAYVWRGWVLHDGACFQPDLWVAIGDFTFTPWINVRHSVLADNHLNEFDFTVDYSHDVGLFTLSAGWINYRYFGAGAGHTNEVYVGAKANVLLQPGVQVYQDVDNNEADGSKGSYVSLSAGQDFPLGKRLSGSAQVALGYNHHQYIIDSGFSDVAFTFKVDVPVANGRVALQPTITYSHVLMSDVEGLFSRWYGGLAVAFK